MSSHSKSRADPRALTCIPAYIGTKDASARLALICDISASGARLLTRTRLEVGERVELSLYLSSEKRDCPAMGRVVRSLERSPKDAATWPYELAVEFEERITEYTSDINALARMQANLALFGKKRDDPRAD